MTKTKGPKQMTKIRHDSGEAIPLNNPVEFNTSVEYMPKQKANELTEWDDIFK